MTNEGRARTVWMLISWLSLILLVIIGFKLYPLNKKWAKIQDRSSQVEFGTDEDLEDVITFLETRLKDRGKFQFQLDNTPLRITNVLFLTDGSGRRLRRDRSAVRVSMIYQRENYFQAQLSYRGKTVTAKSGDFLVELGKVLMIDQSRVIIENEGKIMAYPAPGSDLEKPTELIDFVLPESSKKKIELPKKPITALVQPAKEEKVVPKSSAIKENEPIIVTETVNQPENNSIESSTWVNDPEWKKTIQLSLGTIQSELSGKPAEKTFEALKIKAQEKGISDEIFNKQFDEIGFYQFQAYLEKNQETVLSLIEKNIKRDYKE
ncbi:MAG: hypothetical protein HOK52_05905 [Candidatus Marinimicrobia bacterium]|jgi:hypothetical protein|nr:hypothetical protein [Candidatus Neomarinimicrobiota bacterium]MBT3937608.1 hypothetical protein [Candidatus Neomarinimicrobiota bacterium]MBT3960685.1 hypothetical protein [Candidatus Neomarinimicrobiota bacterium]MBT4382875.1 hypothetical protein [Candidatus Neomarinimicrobiota bacterium]MBT4635075.1 hypothetical protein [Candidatus Neomarinimicrobiota bacterium]